MGVIKIKNFTDVRSIFIKSKSDAMVFVVSDNFNDYYAVMLSMHTPEFNPSARKSMCTHIIRLIDAATDEYNLLSRNVCISFETYNMQFKMTSRLHHGNIRCEDIYIPYDITSVDSLLKGFNDIGIFKDTNNIKMFNYEYSAILAEYSYKIEEEDKRHNEKIKDIRNDIIKRHTQKLRAESKKEKDKTTNNVLSVESLTLLLFYIKNIFDYINDDDFRDLVDESAIEQFYELVKGKTYTEIHAKYHISPSYLSKLNREIFVKRGMPLGTRIYKNKNK